MGTAERADAFVRRQALWARLLDLFRHHRPTEDQLGQVSTLAEVAIDQVFAAHHLTEAQQMERHGGVKDFAECGALYGYVLGYWQARQEMEMAQAALGYGTQFCGDHDTGDRLADAPVEPTRAAPRMAPRADPNGPFTDQQRAAILRQMDRAGLGDDEFAPWLDDLTGKRSLDALAYTDAARVLAALNERARRGEGEGEG